MKKLLFALLVSSTIVGCSSHYRYDCQDPANWQNPLCNKPKCLGEDACTEELIGDRAKGEQHVEQQ
jgi:hypothetical protein